MLKRPRFVIAVRDLARSADYYRDVLGFSIGWNEVPGWRLFTRDACTLMAGECPETQQQHRAHERHDEQRDRDDRDGQVPVLEQAQVDQRVILAQRVEHERDDQGQATRR